MMHPVADCTILAKKQAVSFPSLQKLLPVEAVGIVVRVVGVRVVGAVVRRVVH